MKNDFGITGTHDEVQPITNGKDFMAKMDPLMLRMAAILQPVRTHERDELTDAEKLEFKTLARMAVDVAQNYLTNGTDLNPELTKALLARGDVLRSQIEELP